MTGGIIWTVYQTKKNRPIRREIHTESIDLEEVSGN
jgi:hypothetical protein